MVVGLGGLAGDREMSMHVHIGGFVRREFLGLIFYLRF